MKNFALALVATLASAAVAQEKTATAYVPDKTCPFARESQDPSTAKLLRQVTDTLTSLSEKCDGKLQTPLEALKKALTELGNESGVTRFAEPGPETKGYLGVSVNCANYPDILRAEVEAALEAAHAGSREFPSEDYKKCLAGKDAASCVRSHYLDKMREHRHRCLMAREGDKWREQRQRYEALAQQIGTSMNQVITRADGCKEGAAPYVDMALQGLGLFATLSPALGPYGVGAALGVDVIRSVVHRARPSQMIARQADKLKRQQALDRLACLYLDTLNATVDCPSRLSDLETKIQALRKARGIPEQAPVPKGPPEATAALLGRIAEVQQLLNEIRSAKSDRKRLSELMSKLHKLLESTPVDIPATGTPSMPAAYQRVESLRPFLTEAADWLSNYSEKVKRDRDPFFRDEVERQGRQLKSALESYASMLPKTTPAQKEAAMNAFLESLEPPAEKKEPNLDVEETLMHVLERYDPAYGFRDAAAQRLLLSTLPPSAQTHTSDAARDKLVKAFSSLVNQMQESTDEFFDDSAAKPHLKGGGKEASMTQRTQTFDSFVQPLFRNCALMSGLVYYQAEIDGRRTPLTHIRGGKDQGIHLPIPFKGDKFASTCKPFICEGTDGGVFPFDRLDPNRPDHFHEAQCMAMKTYEARLAAARRNYVLTGDVCKVPAEPGAAPPAKAVPRTGHAPRGNRPPR